MKTPRPTPSRRSFLGKLSVGAGALALGSRVRAQVVSEPKKLGIALVGLGGYSTGQLAPALKMTKHIELKGVVTGSREKGQLWAREFGFPESSIYNYDTLTKIAENKAIDVIYVVTPNSLHAQHTIAAASTRRHVICEKPLANTVADCDAMLRACKEAGVRLAVGYRLHYEPQHQEMMRLARDKDFGPFTKMQGGLAFPINRRVWRVEKAMAGGGPLMDIGIYCLQAACMAADTSGANHPTFAPVAVTAREHPKKRPEFFIDVEETIEWVMEFANGAKAHLITSYNAGMDQFRAESEKGNWIEFKPGFGYGGFKVATNKGPLGITPPQSQQALQLDAMALALRENKPLPSPGEMGRRDMVIIEAIYRSAAEGGKRIEIKV
ncbi:MAG TPA: Gfo/Idh/MocA family oxidoreductase [Opitutaceae bacterium]